MPGAIGRLLRRLRARLRRAETDAEMAEEMAWHRARLVGDLEAGGMPAHQARVVARARFGDTTRIREEIFDMWQLGALDLLVQDLKYAVRTLRRSPGFTLVAVLILGLGIGATTAIFSAVQTLLLRPLPYREPERLMSVSMTREGKDGARRDGMIWSWPKAATFQKLQSVYSNLGLWTWEQLTIGGDEPDREYAEVASARYLGALGVQPALGVDFPPEVDTRPSPEPVALISDELWKRRFNADPRVLGQHLDLDRVPYTVIGVLPPGFHGLSGRANVWAPILARRPDVFDHAFDHSFYMVARLKDGVSPARATAAVEILGGQVNRAFPDRFGPGMGATAKILNQTRVDPRVRRSLLILLGAVGFVLLIACANIANLFLVRANGRAREIALRLAMGAGRARVVRQLVTESTVLAVTGGVAGLMVAWWGVKLLAALNPANALGGRQLTGLGAVSFSTIRLDLPTFAFAGGITLLTGLLFGIVPAFLATNLRLGSALKEGTAQSGSGAARRGGGILVVAEIALALVLLAGSGLMIRSLANRLRIDPGFDPAHVLTLRLSFSPGQTPRDSLPQFYDLLLDRLRGLPGVTDAGLGNCAPLSGG
ncbi:MAG TPA: ABC transporter permease, partial [Gemmatimonadales bacterium]|nr:ABC transporter permease [Gemmatimonadales bacterium]